MLFTEKDKGLDDRGLNNTRNVPSVNETSKKAEATNTPQKVFVDEKNSIIQERVLFTSDNDLNEYVIDLSGGSLGETVLPLSDTVLPFTEEAKFQKKAYIPINGCYLIVPNEEGSLIIPDFILFGGYSVIQGFSTYFLYPELIFTIENEMFVVPASITLLGTGQQISALGILYLIIDVASFAAPVSKSLKAITTLKTVRPNFLSPGLYLDMIKSDGRILGKKLRRSELNSIRLELRKNGIELAIDSRPGARRSRFLPDSALAGFNAHEEKFFLRKGATHYEFLHERLHYQHFLELGPDGYKRLELLWGKDAARLFKESYVFLGLLKNKSALNLAERKHMISYIRRLIEEYKIKIGQGDLSYVRKNADNRITDAFKGM